MSQGYLIQDHRFLDSFVEPGPQVFFQHKFIGHVEQIDLKEEVFAGLMFLGVYAFLLLCHGTPPKKKKVKQI